MNSYKNRYRKYKNIYLDLKLKNSNQIGGAERMTVTSVFNPNSKIPSKYTCKGDNSFPELFINSIPSDTKSLALIVDDPDAPKGLWVHLVAWNIPKDDDKISFFELRKGVFGVNSWGENRWGGPCPPKGDGPHRYFFKVYALDTMLDLPIKTNNEALKRAMEPHILAKAEIVGIYEIEK